MKKTIPNFILSIFLFMNLGCDKEDGINSINDCLETYLKQTDMIGYQGQDLGCKDFLTLYEYQNKQYYVLGNNCADIPFNPTDCDGNTPCENGKSKSCNKFLLIAERIGVVGIEL